MVDLLQSRKNQKLLNECLPTLKQSLQVIDLTLYFSLASWFQAAPEARHWSGCGAVRVDLAASDPKIPFSHSADFSGLPASRASARSLGT
jgi:hypothetical protein